MKITKCKPSCSVPGSKLLLAGHHYNIILLNRTDWLVLHVHAAPAAPVKN